MKIATDCSGVATMSIRDNDPVIACFAHDSRFVFRNNPVRAFVTGRLAVHSYRLLFSLFVKMVSYIRDNCHEIQTVIQTANKLC